MADYSPAAAIAHAIDASHAAVFRLLRRIATTRAVEYELAVTRRTLLESHVKLAGYIDCDPVCDQLAVFLPGNMVLYSLVLYALLPSRLCRQVVVRPGGASRGVVEELFALLAPALPRGLVLFEGSGRAFARLAAQASAVVFCGRRDTAEKIGRDMRHDAMFMFLGSGINPFVVTTSARLDRAIDAAAADRSFNGGRDCICPDLFLVDAALIDRFVPQLCQRVGTLPSGDLDDDDVEICESTNAPAHERTLAFLDAHRDRVVMGGRPDVRGHVLEPTVILHGDEAVHDPPEFFGPIWNVQRCRSIGDIRDILARPAMVRRAQGVTIFGGYPYPLPSAYSLVARDRGLFDVEDGNQPFGGWSTESSYVRYEGVIYEHPVLVSRELLHYLGQRSGLLASTA